ncbi:Rgg/GadR/MutR family transcriptional regulator [Atopococcus tabaci]|uniref:Rgg/GadR/MutR family transcriptional regulator n=1 Tax=Atopococcus tabaci TaxID=269774 RepID=UPI000408F07C|nr:Rgg/GadR/MutR family transcriptional regulator [Atopococcus tabaci]
MYGKTFQTIRKRKGMTLKEACGTALSVSQLSRFENDKSMIPVDLFFEVLKNINTSIEEFDYFLGRQDKKQLFERFDLIETYTNNRQFDKLVELKTTIQKERPGPYSWDQFLIYFIDSLTYLNENGRHQSQQAVLNYLMQVEDWGEMELRLYAIFGFTLNVETTYTLMHTALKRSKLYQAIPQDIKLLYTILSNNFSTFLYHGNLQYAEETIRLFEDRYSENTELFYPHIDFMFNKGILAFKKQHPEDGEKYCGQAINICRLFRQKESEERYQKRYKQWRESYEDPEYHELIINIGFLEEEDA